MTATRKVIPYRRRTRPQLPPQVLQWPRFVVTAAHSVLAPKNSPYARMPVGVWHARLVGSPQTMCGRSALTWTYFWPLDFRQSDRELACAECARLVGLDQ
jgi:hypothetical protein